MRRVRTRQGRARLTAWAIVALALALTALIVILVIASGDNNALFIVPVNVLPIVGAVILTNRQGNRIGQLMLWCGTAAIAAWTLDAYARFAATREDWPLADWAAWLSQLTNWLPVMTYVVLLLLLFPTGTFLSPRWRIVLVLFTVESVTTSALVAIQPGTLENYGDYPQLINPLGIAPLAEIASILTVFQVLTLPTVALAIAAAIVRFHRAHGVEREQMKWFVFVAATILSLLLLFVLASVLMPKDVAFVVQVVAFFSIVLSAVIGLPVAIAVAVLRYQLYDIDQIVNRAIVYALLSIGLLATYLTIVLGLGTLVRQGTGESSPVVVAISTLAVAGMFRSLRSRIQSVVDRRFYRHKYDAERTLEQFSTRLRDEIDLDALSVELQRVVQEAMHPSTASLWLRCDFGTNSSRASLIARAGHRLPTSERPLRDTAKAD